VEVVAVATLTVCIFLAFYFAFLSFQEADDALRKQLVTLATYSLIAGVAIMACMMMYAGIRKAFSRIGDQLKRIREPREPSD
jgi:hypothetical protein